MALAAQGSASLPRSILTVHTPHGAVQFTVEIAADQPSRERGLMFRKHLDRNAGMLFEFPADQFQDFWMKNTILPLDMLFIRSDGTISSIAANTTPYSEKVVSSSEPVRAVLEINGGEAATLGLVPGEHVHNSFFHRDARGK
jgi:hypothetical protein